ncbi:GxxExxY protein [Aridibaculum aurantiacum]|uniref:GxxExxY protein n=1 Tax=Aridibaculum aurantiacum TaxID=2810307 RepID=UPI001A95DFF8|nr:GxxExxY protein [Aridibaculum aurantiacum]
MNDNYLHSEITSNIIAAFYAVYNKLGYGFLEKVYERCLLIELGKLGHHPIAQHPINVHYENHVVGHYIADILVDDKVIVEVKAADALSKEHEAQLTNYLKATDIEVGLLVNFGKKAEFKRKVFSAQYKYHNLPPRT